MLYPLFEGASALASSGATYLTPKTVIILILAKNYCYQNSQAYSMFNLVKNDSSGHKKTGSETLHTDLLCFVFIMPRC